MFKLNLKHECSLNRNPFEVCNIPRPAHAGQGEKHCVCSECWGYCSCQALTLTVTEHYLSVTCHLSEGTLWGLCSVMRLAYLAAS